MKEKIKKILNNSLAREIVKFFYNNQASIDTVSGISAWVQEDKEKVKKVLDDLVGLGILDQSGDVGTMGYCYTRDDVCMKIVKKALEDYD